MELTSITLVSRKCIFN